MLIRENELLLAVRADYKLSVFMNTIIVFICISSLSLTVNSIQLVTQFMMYLILNVIRYLNYENYLVYIK